MRKEFAKVIEELIGNDKRVHLITLDYDYRGLRKLFEAKSPNCWNFGVTEQASIGIASGMALEGLKPYVYTITPFLLERPYEQIKLDIVAQKANVKLISFWDYPDDGITHITKDPEGLCKILGIEFFKPKDSIETRKLLLDSYDNDQPAFFYLTKDNNI